MSNIKKCRYCNSDIDNYSKACSNCGKKQGMPKWIIISLITFAVVVLGSIGSNDSNTNLDNIETSALVNTNQSVYKSNNNEEIIDNKVVGNVEEEKLAENTQNNTSVQPNNYTSQSKVITEEKNYTVYITKTGSKYHKSGCRYLKKSCIETTLRAAQAEGYDACSVCNP